MSMIAEPDEDRPFCAAESDVIEEYVRLLHEGRDPDIDQFLGRHPEMADGLRPALEGAALVYREYQEYVSARATRPPSTA